MTNNTYERNGVNFAGILTVLFIGLKLTNFIDWSWWWVLSPLWIPIAFVLVALFVISLIQPAINIHLSLSSHWCMYDAVSHIASVLKSKLKLRYNKFRGL